MEIAQKPPGLFCAYALGPRCLRHRVTLEPKPYQSALFSVCGGQQIVEKYPFLQQVCRWGLGTLQIPLFSPASAFPSTIVRGHAPAHGPPSYGGEGIPPQPRLGEVSLHRLEEAQGDGVIIFARRVTAPAQERIDQVVMLFREPALFVCERRQRSRLPPRERREQPALPLN